MRSNHDHTFQPIFKIKFFHNSCFPYLLFCSHFVSLFVVDNPVSSTSDLTPSDIVPFIPIYLYVPLRFFRVIFISCLLVSSNMDCCTSFCSSSSHRVISGVRKKDLFEYFSHFHLVEFYWLIHYLQKVKRKHRKSIQIFRTVFELCSWLGIRGGICWMRIRARL